jgi:hypothetical protein
VRVRRGWGAGARGARVAGEVGSGVEAGGASQAGLLAEARGG